MTEIAPHRRFSTAVFWAIAARQSDRLLGVLSISILSRLLSPADFGVVAMSSAVAAITEVLTSFGFDWALLRIRAPTRAHYDTAWTLKVLTGAFTFLALAASAYPFAKFYHQPAVAGILVAMGLIAAVSSLENIGTVDFRRNLRFDVEFNIRFIGKATGVISSITIAYSFHTYWSLVAGLAVNRIFSVVATYWFSPFRPRWCLEQYADLLSFSWWTLVGAIVDTTAARFAQIYIGRVLSARGVGLYAMAVDISSIAISEVAAPINRVAFSKYTAQAQSTPALRYSYFQITGLIWLIGFPAAIGICICAPNIVALLLGPKWGSAVPVLRILAIESAIAVMAANTHYIYLALGRSRFVTTLSGITALIFVIVTVLVGQRYGLAGVAVAQLLAAIITLTFNYVALMRTLEISLFEICENQWRTVVASLFMGGIVLTTSRSLLLSHLNELIRTAALVSEGAIAYSALILLLWFIAGRPSGAEQSMWSRFRELLT